MLFSYILGMLEYQSSADCLYRSQGASFLFPRQNGRPPGNFSGRSISPVRALPKTTNSPMISLLLLSFSSIPRPRVSPLFHQTFP